jgi:hypothetical protein
MGRLLVDLPIDVESCSLGNATNNTYLGGANAILKQAAKNPAATPADRTALSALVTVLNSQSQLIGGQLPISACAAYSFALQKVLDFLAKAAPEAQALAEKLKVVEADLAFFAALVAGISPELDKVVAPLVKISKILDNPACPTSIQAFKAQGLKAIKNCGLVQGIDLIGLINKFAGTALNKKVAPLVLSLQKYVPTIIKLEGLAKKDVPALGAKFAAIPGTLDKFAEMVGGFVPKVDSAGNAITNGVDKLAILNASLVAMNQKTLNGDNIPYGNATGPAGTTVTMAAWQINQNGAGETGKDLSLNLGIALILFLIAGGVGTAMYRHRRSS